MLSLGIRCQLCLACLAELLKAVSLNEVEGSVGVRGGLSMGIVDEDALPASALCFLWFSPMTFLAEKEGVLTAYKAGALSAG